MRNMSVISELVSNAYDVLWRNCLWKVDVVVAATVVLVALEAC
jgi:hypothetical protein